MGRKGLVLIPTQPLTHFSWATLQRLRTPPSYSIVSCMKIVRILRVHLWDGWPSTSVLLCCKHISGKWAWKQMWGESCHPCFGDCCSSPSESFIRCGWTLKRRVWGWMGSRGGRRMRRMCWIWRSMWIGLELEHTYLLLPGQTSLNKLSRSRFKYVSSFPWFLCQFLLSWCVGMWLGKSEFGDGWFKFKYLSWFYI